MAVLCRTGDDHRPPNERILDRRPSCQCVDRRRLTDALPPVPSSTDARKAPVVKPPQPPGKPRQRAYSVNMKAHICQLCSFTLQPYSFVPSVYMLDESHILSTAVGNITLTYPDSRNNTLSFSPQCIHKLPCHCSLSTADIYIPPHFTYCGPVDYVRLRARNASWFPVTHVTNLPVLQHFFSDENLGYLAADTLLDLPIQASLPNFTLFTHNSSTTLAAIDNTEFRLSKAPVKSPSDQWQNTLAMNT